jgi:hypothetical protein
MSVQLLSQTFLILRLTQRDIIITVLHVNYPSSLSDFHQTYVFSIHFRKIIKYQILSKSVKWDPSCSTRTEGQTDTHHEANSRFSKFFRTRPESNSEFTNISKLRVKSVRSIVEVSIEEVTRVIRRINNEGVLTGTQDLAQTLDRCNKAQWRLH